MPVAQQRIHLSAAGLALTNSGGRGSISPLIRHARIALDSPSNEEEPMKYLVRALGFAVGLASLVAVTSSTQAQEGTKLYVFSSGSLGGFPKVALQIGGQGNIDWAPVSFYVIKDPRGNIIFD